MRTTLTTVTQMNETALHNKEQIKDVTDKGHVVMNQRLQTTLNARESNSPRSHEKHLNKAEHHAEQETNDLTMRQGAKATESKRHTLSN